MINQIAYTMLFGKPLILWGGLVTLICLLFTALISVLNNRGNHKIPFKWHPIMARVTIVLGIIHGVMGILAYF